MRIQKLNAQLMIEIKQYEYALLNEIAQDSILTQANLSNRLGIAVFFVSQKNLFTITQTFSQLKDPDWKCSVLDDRPLFEDVKCEIKKKRA